MHVICDNNQLVNSPEVSVFCPTYNQESYIAKCLDGILGQETSFPFEVLVNDDASSDNTPVIVRSYAERRRDLVTAVFHEQNQYSQGLYASRDFLFPRARGKYIALCEGDDYWTDPHKLQRQYEAMEEHPNATWCVHASTYVEADTEKRLFDLRPFDHDCVLDFRQTLGQVQFAATASFFVRRDAYAKYIDSPISRIDAAGGDFKMSRFFALTGETVYLERLMSAYRVFAKNSINSGIAQSKNWREIVICNTEKRIAFLRALDEWSGSDYSEDISAEIENMEYLGFIDVKDYHALVNGWRERFSQESFTTRLKVRLLGARPNLHDAVRSFKFTHFPYSGLRS